MRNTNLVSVLVGAVVAVLETDTALATRVRAVLGIESAAIGDDWIPLARAPLAKKTARRLAKSGAIAAKKEGGRLYLSRASLDAYMREERPNVAIVDSDSALRAELGLRRAS